MPARDLTRLLSECEPQMEHVKFLVGEGDAEPTEVVEADFEDVEWEVLQRFCEHSEELFSTSKLAREGIPTSLNVSWDRESGLKVSTVLPDWNEVIVLLHKLRRLTLQNEPTSFQKVRKIVSRRFEHGTTRAHLKYLHKKFFGGDLRSLVAIYASGPEHDEFHLLNSEETLQAWLNGFEYHGNADKRAFIESLHGLMPLDSSKVVFLLMLQEKVAAIHGLRKILAVLRGEEHRTVVRLPAEDPLRHRILLLPVIRMIQYFDEIDHPHNLPEVPEIVHFDATEGSGIADLMTAIWFLWNRWLDSSIKPALGLTHVFIEVPDGYVGVPATKPSKNALLIFGIEVHAVVITTQGRMQLKPAKDPSTGNAYLAPDSSGIRFRNTTCIDNQGDLKRFLEDVRSSNATVDNIQKVPRFMFESSFWPLIPRTYEKLLQMRQEGREPSFQDIEGSDLSSAWEIFAELVDVNTAEILRRLVVDPSELDEEIRS